MTHVSPIIVGSIDELYFLCYANLRVDSGSSSYIRLATLFAYDTRFVSLLLLILVLREFVETANINEKRVLFVMGRSRAFKTACLL